MGTVAQWVTLPLGMLVSHIGMLAGVFSCSGAADEGLSTSAFVITWEGQMKFPPLVLKPGLTLAVAVIRGVTSKWKTLF